MIINLTKKRSMETKYLVAIIIAALLILLNGGFLIYFCILKRKNTKNEMKRLKNQPQTELSSCSTNHKQTKSEPLQIDKTSQLNSVISDRKILSSTTLMQKEESKQQHYASHNVEISGNECNTSSQEHNGNKIAFDKDSNCFNDGKDEYNNHSKDNYIDFQESKNDLNECNTNNVNSIMNDYTESNNNVAPYLESEIKKQIEHYILDYDEKQLIRELQSKPTHLNIN